MFKLSNKIKTLISQNLMIVIAITISHSALANDASTTLAYQFKQWNKTPIDFVVPVHKQRILSFDEKVSLAERNDALTTDDVSIINNDGTLYISALKAFKPVLLALRLQQSGQVVLVYLSSTDESKDNQPVKIILPKAENTNGSTTTTDTSTTVNAVTLTRFAVQQFSNQRLAAKPSNITRTPLLTQKHVNLYYGSSVTAYPLISWHSGDYYVSAVQFKNNLTENLTLDPRNLIGDWQAASFYPSNTLEPRGMKHDNTLVFVVSHQPFGQALLAVNPFARRGN